MLFCLGPLVLLFPNTWLYCSRTLGCIFPEHLVILFPNTWLYCSRTLGCIVSEHLVVLFPNTFKIFWISNLSILSVHDKGYSRKASCALNLIFTFLLHMTIEKVKTIYRFDKLSFHRRDNSFGYPV